MTVQDLIIKLKEFRPDCEVVTVDEFGDALSVKPVEKVEYVPCSGPDYQVVQLS